MPIWSAEIKELETLLTSIKGRFPDLEKDLEHLIKTDDENVALLYSRRCLEIIVTDLCETELHRPRKTEPLKGIIDKLNREEKVPPHIITSMLSLNSLSTYGTHPKDFDPEQVKPALSNLTIIIKWYLKYKNIRPVSKKSDETVKEGSETVKDETRTPKDETRTAEDENLARDVSPGSAQKQKGKRKKLVLLLSGLALIVVIVIVALVVFNVMGSRKFSRVDIDLEKSIAVLPFINDSPDEENVYFINGIMEEVLNNLQTIRDLRVISRSSVEQYRDATRPTAPEISRKLGVNYIVEGSGQKYGNTIRLRVQLIEAPKDRHLWGESYEQEIEETRDIFRIQTRIAESIAAELKAIITPAEKQLIEKTATTSLTAYDFYQRGREEYSKYQSDNSNRESLDRAEDFYFKALQYDSTFAQAYTGLSRVYWYKHYYEEYFSERFLDSVLILADMAISFDDRLSEAYAIRGQYYRESGKPEEAVKEYDKALEFNPNDWMVYYYKGSIYMWVLEDFVKSIENLHEAVIRNRGEELPSLLSSLARAYLDIGFVDKAKYYYEEVFKLETDSNRYFRRLAWIEFSAGNFEKAIEFIEKAYEIDSTDLGAILSILFQGNIRRPM
jgi:TolB-like protein